MPLMQKKQLGGKANLLESCFGGLDHSCLGVICGICAPSPLCQWPCQSYEN